ncbi:MAG: HAMP domain-containing protein [Parcubacteria group bacterium]|nr:HAMP domain-containing protein [Parcubacteria group bacterium]
MKLAPKISLIIVVSSCVSLTLSGILIYSSVRNALKKSISERQLALTQTTIDALDRLLYERQSDVQNLATQRIMQDVLLSDASYYEFARYRATRQLKEMQALSGEWLDLSVFTTDGARVISTNDDRVGSAIQSYDIYYSLLTQALSGSAVYSDVVIAEDIENEKPIIIFMAPIRAETVGGAIIGAIEARFAWPVALELLYALRDSTAYLFNNAGAVIGINDFQKRKMILNKNYNDNPQLASMITTMRGVTIAPDFEAARDTVTSYAVEGGYFNYHGNNWLLVLQTPVETAFAAAQRLAFSTIIFFGALSLMSIIFILYFINRFAAEPIGVLTKSVQRIAGGDLSQRIEVRTHDEVGVLANSFNSMASQLQELYIGLDKKVQEKTRALTRELKMAELKKEI